MKLTLIGIAGIYCLIAIALYFGTRRGFNMSNPLSTKTNSEKENLLFFFVSSILLTDFTFRVFDLY